MRKYIFFFLFLSICNFTYSQNLRVIDEGQHIGITIENITEIPDSVILFWTCDPLQGRKELYHQKIYIGDTLRFDANHYLHAFAILCYPWDDYGWQAQFSNWTAHSWFESTQFIQHIPAIIPVIKLLDTPGFGNNQSLRVVSNGYKTRVSIFRVSTGNVVYQQNFTGVEGTEIQHQVQTSLQAGIHIMTITSHFTDVLLCKHSTVLRFPFTVVQ